MTLSTNNASYTKKPLPRREAAFPIIFVSRRSASACAIVFVAVVVIAVVGNLAPYLMFDSRCQATVAYPNRMAQHAVNTRAIRNRPENTDGYEEKNPPLGKES
jgi:hypothetical protein